jgi:hypothetical protein
VWARAATTTGHATRLGTARGTTHQGAVVRALGAVAVESGKGASCWDALRRWTWARAVRLAPRNAPTLAVVGAKPTVTDAATSNTSTIAIKMPHRIEISGSPLLDWRHGGLELSGCDSLADRTRSFSARILGLRPILVSAVREKTAAEEGVRVLEGVGCWRCVGCGEKTFKFETRHAPRHSK